MTTQPLSTTPLSVALRAATAEAHEGAETASFVTELIEGSACPSAFAALVTQQLVIYEALEDVIGLHAEHPLLAPLHDERLNRSAALRHDVSVLMGPEATARIGAGSLAVQPATFRYAEELRTRHTPELVVAHHYVRYLGDLSGGQIISRMVSRHYGIPDEALSFYRFEGIDKIKRYKDAYRAALDALPATPRQRDEILAQAVRSFELNRQVFADLGVSRAAQHAAAGVAA